MKTWFTRGPARLFVALGLCLIAFVSLGCGGSSSPGKAKFSVDADFAESTSRALPGYVGSIRVTLQTGTDTPIELTPINRQTLPVIVEVTAERDYTFTVIAYQGEQLNGAIVGRLTFTRRSPKRGNTETVMIDNVNTEVASLQMTLPNVTLCGSTVDVMVEARNAAGNPILNCDQDSSFGFTVAPANAGTVAFDAGKCQFTATSDVSMDGTEVRITAALAGRTVDAVTTLDCAVSKLLMNLHWNADTRGLPGYAQSARITVRHFGALEPVCEKIVNRTNKDAYIEPVECPEPLQDGSYQVTLEAFADADAAGKMVASEVFTIALEPGEAPVTVDMSASAFQVDHLVYTVIRNGVPVPDANPLVLIVGETVDINVDAVNSAGEVLLSGDDIVNTFSGSSVEQVDNDTVKATLVGNSSSVSSNIGGEPGPFIRAINVVAE